MIVAAAYKKHGEIYIGKNHGEILQRCAKLKIYFNDEESHEGGFVDETGKFLDRVEAGKHALECGQIKELKYFGGKKLDSCDLYDNAGNLLMPKAITMDKLKAEQIKAEFNKKYNEVSSKWDFDIPAGAFDEISAWIESQLQQAEDRHKLKYPIGEQLQLMLKDYREICCQIKPVENITENELSIENELDMQEDIILSFVGFHVKQAEDRGEGGGIK